MNNQHGAALISVLLIFTLIGIFSSVILSVVLSSAKQTDHTEQSMQSKHLAEMGIELYRSHATDLLEDIINEVIANREEEDTQADIQERICTTISNRAEQFKIVPVRFPDEDGVEASFQVITEDVSTNPNGSLSCSNYKQLYLSYSAVGSISQAGSTADKEITGSLVLQTPGFSGGDGDNGEGGGSDDRVFHDEEEFDTITSPSYPPIPGDIDYEEINQNDIDSCISLSDSYIQEGHTFGAHCESHTVEGSFKTDGNTTLLNNASLHIKEHGTFNGGTKLENNAGLEVDGNATFQGADFMNNATLKIGQNAVFFNDVVFKQNAYSGNEETQSNGIGGNAVFHGGVTMENNSYLHIGGNFYARERPVLNNNAFLQIDGSAFFENGLENNKADIMINGNLFLEGEDVRNKGTICVTGRLEGSTNESVVYQNTCGNKSGVIYVLGQNVSSPVENDNGGGSNNDWNIDFDENHYSP